VPAITALGAVALLGEAFGPRQALASLGILGGIALVLRGRMLAAPRLPEAAP
jgi:drug/metabolite transporter (DMT)-like permease